MTTGPLGCEGLNDWLSASSDGRPTVPPNVLLIPRYSSHWASCSVQFRLWAVQRLKAKFSELWSVITRKESGCVQISYIRQTVPQNCHHLPHLAWRKPQDTDDSKSRSYVHPYVTDYISFYCLYNQHFHTLSLCYSQCDKNQVPHP